MPRRPLNKSAFVRSLPHLTAAQVVSKAKMRGFKLSTAHVYVIRSAERRKAQGASRRSSTTKSAPLQTTIERLTREFAAAVVAEIRRASMNELASL